MLAGSTILSRGYTIALDIEGNIWSWGYNVSGQLGNGTTVNGTVPKKINLNAKFKKVVSAYANSIAIDTEDNVWICGQSGAEKTNIYPNLEKLWVHSN